MSEKITSGFTSVVPAYGRNYKNRQDAKADFLAGKDFKLCLTGQYCSIRDFGKGAHVEIHFKPLGSVVVEI